MAYEYTWIDGERVEVHVAAAYAQLEAAFQAAWGLDLIISSGTRTREEQAALYEAYLEGRGNLAAPPGYSNHEEDGPIGPVAIDIHDSGDDAGVTVRGSARDAWMEANAGRFGFSNAGYNFSQVEAWHKEWTGSLDGAGGGSEHVTVNRSVADIQRLVGAYPDDIWGPETDGKVRVWQSAHGLDPDGIWGPLSDAAGFPPAPAGDQVTIDRQNFLNAARGEHLDVDGVQGPLTTDAIKRYQEFLRAYGYAGEIDGIWGDGTQAAHQKYYDEWAGHTPSTPTGPVGSNVTSRPTREVQQFLIDHGYDLGPSGADDDYGAATTAAVSAWQQSVGLEPDGIWGNASDGLAFPVGLFGVDYSFARPDIPTLVQRGVKHVGRYLWPNSKGITKDEYAALKAAGLAVWLIYEEDGRELLGGHDAGVTVAQKADTLLQQLGLADYAIYFNVDFDPTDAEIPVILDALDGIASVIGPRRVGLYGDYDMIKAAFDAGKITWGFQTYAWSGGQWDARAHLQQFANGQWGDTVDFTRAVKPEFGQHPVIIEPGEQPEPEPEPETPPHGIPRADLQRVRDGLDLIRKDVIDILADIDSWLA